MENGANNRDMQQDTQESKYRKWLFNEVTFFIAASSLLWGVFTAYKEPQETSAEQILKLDGRVTTLERLTNEQIININRNIEDIKKAQETLMKAVLNNDR